VSTGAANRAADPQLRRNALGLPELVFQGVTHIAPAANMVFSFPLIALKAGPAMPLSFLLATIVCLFIGNTVSQFSKYMPSSGGYYSFATRGLGSRPGFMATWSYLIYDILGPAGSTGFLGYLISDMVRTQFDVDIPWWLIAVVTFAVIWILTRQGIRLSMWITALLGGLELLIMLALAITFLIHPGPGSSYTAPLNPASSPNHLEGIVAGMVFSIVSLNGFESPAPLAQESRRAGKLVGQAVILSLLSIGAFFIFASYASAVGWGTGDMAQFASNPNPYYVLGHALWGAGWWLVVLAFINSAIAVGLACTNSASRPVHHGPRGRAPCQFRQDSPHPPNTDVRNRLPADCRDSGGAARGLAVASGIYLWLSGDAFCPWRHCSLRHGKSGPDLLHAPGSSGQLHCLAARRRAVGRNAVASAGLVRYRLSGTRLAV